MVQVNWFSDYGGSMRGQIAFLKMKSGQRKNNSYGFIRGIDGKMYWFLLDGVKDMGLGNIVEFEGVEDEKGYVAKQIQMLEKAAMY